MTLLADLPTPTVVDPRAVYIPDERQQYYVDFLQKLDRIMTGLPLKVIVKNLNAGSGSDTRAETDGKRLWMDWSVLRDKMRTETRLGLNYHQVAHVYFGDPRYDRDVQEMKLAANILLDCRDETLFAMTYPSVTPYFVSMVQEMLIKGRNLEDCQNIWPLLYGRKYLPHPIRFVSAPKKSPEWVKIASVLIDQFVALDPERKNVKEMVSITGQFHEALKSAGIIFSNPGGGRLIRGSKKVAGDVDDSVKRRIKIIIEKDRGELKKRVRVVQTAPENADLGNGTNSGRTGGTNRNTDLDEDIDYEIVEIDVVNHTVYEETRNDSYSEGGGTVEVTSRVTPRGDNQQATDHAESYQDGSGAYGPGGSGGANLKAVKLIEEGDEDPTLTKYVWVEDKLDAGWNKGSHRLDRFREVLTNETVKDIVRTLEAEVLFDTDQLTKAGWEGCGAVTANIRAVRNRFEHELAISAKTLRSRFGAGKRGSVSMRLAMKAERMPTSNVFKTKIPYMKQNDLQVEMVMLIDASGSMDRVIRQAMKAQWIIGSAFERKGAKVTIIPFNNKARDPLKGRNDSFSDKIFPFCEANGGTQPTAALNTAQEIFDGAGSRFKMLFILTDGAWNNTDWAIKLIDKMNHKGVLTTLVLMGGDGHDFASMKHTDGHHCKEWFRVSGINELLPEMRKTFFKAFNKAIIRTLKRYH